MKKIPLIVWVILILYNVRRAIRSRWATIGSKLFYRVK